MNKRITVKMDQRLAEAMAEAIASDAYTISISWFRKGQEQYTDHRKLFHGFPANAVIGGLERHKYQVAAIPATTSAGTAVTTAGVPLNTPEEKQNASIVDCTVDVEEGLAEGMLKAVDVGKYLILLNWMDSEGRERFYGGAQNFPKGNIANVIEHLKQLYTKEDIIPATQVVTGVWDDSPAEPGKILQLNQPPADRIPGEAVPTIPAVPVQEEDTWT